VRGCWGLRFSRLPAIGPWVPAPSFVVFVRLTRSPAFRVARSLDGSYSRVSGRGKAELGRAAWNVGVRRGRHGRCNHRTRTGCAPTSIALLIPFSRSAERGDAILRMDADVRVRRLPFDVDVAVDAGSGSPAVGFDGVFGGDLLGKG